MKDNIYDCIVVGGGPSGLTCAIYLARFRRNILLIENRKCRNYASEGIHGFLGYDGIKPGELLKRARREALKYGVKFYINNVKKINGKKQSYEVITNDIKFKSKKIVLAYGVKDIFPSIKGLDKYYGKSIHHCPVCDGYEIKNKKVGVIGSKDNALGLALELMQWTNQIIILTNGNKNEFDIKKRRKLSKYKIDIKEKKIIKLLGNNIRLKKIELESGERIKIDSLFFTIDVKNSCTLAEDLRCEIEKVNNKIKVNKNRETSIKGIFAIGDLLKGPQLVVTACADGAIAAIEINKQLLKESLIQG